MTNLYAVIMAGGAGTRFWPASRHKRPKQLLPLAGADTGSLLAMTRRRIGPLFPAARTFVVTAAHLTEATQEALPDVPSANILSEPAARNTAAAIGWATMMILRENPEAVIGVFPSDHYVADEDGFRYVVNRAIDGANAGFLTTIGIVPTRPETGYGYIERGAELESGIYRAARFVEKPILPVAQDYLAGKRHLWNAGMFFFRAGAMRDAIRAHLPALAVGLDELGAALTRGSAEERGAALNTIFPRLPSISIDHGVMERAHSVAVVPGDFGWNDVGSWQSAWELGSKDAAGNVLPEGTIASDATGNLICDLTRGPHKRKFALVGVSGMVLVETDDAVLLIPRERAQDVRTIVESLKARDERDLL